ncbi:TlpA family protein disulfide reductase, partial [Pelagibacterales bacterium SAG-MED30]|nr:TlpA family protein disulfide reductase [Pelagibacterales bacterium SAG-MED30]
MRLFIIFIFLLSNSFAKEVPNIKNIVINEELKTYKNLAFLDSKQDIVELNNYEGKLVILNFWATWCAPCKKEMPSLDSLKSNKVLDNLEIFPINIGKDNLKKSQKFFSELNI